VGEEKRKVGVRDRGRKEEGGEGARMREELVLG
jgi:hypothetical protein